MTKRKYFIKYGKYYLTHRYETDRGLNGYGGNVDKAVAKGYAKYKEAKAECNLLNYPKLKGEFKVVKNA